jgi:hypothetical protein
MSALALTPTLSLLTEDERIELLERCRFCGCTEDRPCLILWREDAAGIYRLALHEYEADFSQPCAWYIPGVCSAAECVEKLLLEARGKVVLFDAGGKRASL